MFQCCSQATPGEIQHKPRYGTWRGFPGQQPLSSPPPMPLLEGPQRNTNLQRNETLQRYPESVEYVEATPSGPSPFTRYFGDTLLRYNTSLGEATSVPTAQALQNKDVYVYFSAHWCGPCRGFTPQLITWYKAKKAENPNFEVVFISWDGDESSFMTYFKTMPWFAMPFNKINPTESTEYKTLKGPCNVNGIPTLCFFDRNGTYVDSNRRGEVTSYLAANAPLVWEMHEDGLKDVGDKTTIAMFVEEKPQPYNLAEIKKWMQEAAQQFPKPPADDSYQWIMVSEPDMDGYSAEMRHDMEFKTGHHMVIISVPQMTFWCYPLPTSKQDIINNVNRYRDNPTRTNPDAAEIIFGRP